MNSKTLIFCSALFLGALANILAQTTKILPLQPDSEQDRSRVYHPEPILFIHGINSNDAGWTNVAIPDLTPLFAAYDLPDGAVPLQGAFTNLNAQQETYLHTFNYGDPPSSNTLNKQSFDRIEWNAWHQDMTGRVFTNIYLSATNRHYAQPAPNDQRQCLDDRISEVRQAYSVGASAPQIVLVAHSMGGILAHYYMIESGTNSGVRRVVCLATPHLGSHLANYLIWHAHANFFGRNLDGVTGLFIPNLLRLTSQAIPYTAGYFRYTDGGAVEDISVNQFNGPAKFQHHNPLADFFWNNAAPKIEYVFDAYQRGTNSQYFLLWATVNDVRLEPENRQGDGVVAPWSASGKTNSASASIWNGASNANGAHYIDPVVFGIWSNFDHSHANQDTNSLFASLDGVPYEWPGGSTNNWPAYAQRYGENQSFSKYFTSPSSNTTAYTDEPGIADLKLLYDRGGGNPLLIPALNTWSTNSGQLVKTYINGTDLAGHQIVSGRGSVTYLGTVGVKNFSQNPVGTSRTNYWIASGNEYLPASESLHVSSGTTPIVVATNVASLSGVRMITNCLVQLGNTGAPQYEYGYFENTGVSMTAGANNYVAAQGYNLAQLITPQAERAFNTPVDSATLVAILQKINHSEALSNACHNPTTPTRWQTTVAEWANANTGAITLDFFPTSSSPKVSDAWTNAAFSGTYTPASKTLTFDPANAPSQLIFSNNVYLGCYETFTNSYGGIVPALTSDALAGIPIDEAFLDTVRSSLEAIFPKYENTYSSTCSNWTKPDIIKQATSNVQTDWTPVVGGLL
jgi:pimeloyl-ACP methyl ester carboxylesterase